MDPYSPDPSVSEGGVIPLDTTLHELIYHTQPPSVIHGAKQCPVLAGGQRAQPIDISLALTQFLLEEQQQRYGHGEQPPVLIQPLPYSGPPLRYLLSGRQVKFCTDREQALHEYQTLPAGEYWPVPEYAACVQGPAGAGIVRARINKTGAAPTAITTTLADRLGLQRYPLPGAGAVAPLYGNRPFPLEVLTEPLTVQLLAGPGHVAFEITLPAVVVAPSNGGPDRDIFELQLGLYDFCEAVEFDWLPLWASQFEHRESGYRWALPVVAPRHLPPHRRIAGSSTFHVTQETWDVVLELALVRQAVQARRAAAAAAAAASAAAEGDAGDSPSPAEAAAEVMQQASRIAAAPAAAVILPVAAGTASGPAAGTQEWIDEWPPQARQQQQRQQQRWRPRGRGSRRGGGRGSSRGGARDEAAAAAAGMPPAAAAPVVDAAAAAHTTAGVYAGLDPLPTGLVACAWPNVAATSLPAGEDTCCICTDAFTDDLDDGSVRLVTQLPCRHTYCVLCLRQLMTRRAFRRQPLHCPQCRLEV